jgi:hypothetical protein
MARLRRRVRYEQLEREIDLLASELRNLYPAFAAAFAERPATKRSPSLSARYTGPRAAAGLVSKGTRTAYPFLNQLDESVIFVVLE